MYEDTMRVQAPASGDHDQSVYQPARDTRPSTSGGRKNPRSENTNHNFVNNMFEQIDQIDNIGTGTRQLTYESLPETLINPIYVPAYLRNNIGKWARLELLIGNSVMSRIGRIAEVGAAFVVIQPTGSSTTMMCDIYSIKFVTIINDPDVNNMMDIQ